MQPSDSDDELDAPDGPGSSHIPPSIYVIKFHPSTAREAIEWMIERIEAKNKYGGAELLVRCEPQKQSQGVTVHVSATKIKLLEVAEAVELQKRAASGLIQEFSVRDLDQFLYAGQTLDTVLTPGEREFCVRHELDALRAKQEEGHVPGYPAVKLYPGQPLMNVYLEEQLITDLFPLHDRQVLESLASDWYKAIFQGAPLGGLLPNLGLPPLPFPKKKKDDQEETQTQIDASAPYEDRIRNYFGESVAMYFGFLGFYTLALSLPAALGVAQLFFSVDTLSEYALFAAFNLVWVTVLLEFWKRRCSGLAYSWGTLLHSQNLQATRPAFKGKMMQHPITGRFEPTYPEWKTRSKLYMVSAPAVGFCVVAALWVMVAAFWAEEQLIDWKRRYGSIAGVFTHVPSAFYACLVWLMNYYYRRLALALTDWENHRTQEAYDWHRVSKLLVFQFVNNFSSLFYIAFYIQDMDMLCSQVATMLIVTQMINHFQEALLPYVVKKAYNQFAEEVLAHLKKHPLTAHLFEEPVKTVHGAPPEEEAITVLALDPKDPRIVQAKEEADLDPYQQDCYEDYLEMFLQFGYVFLFSSVYPMAAFWAVLNNILELKTDAFKLCRVFRRPRVKKVASIGVWQGAFELLGAVAVMTNCALLCLSPRVRPLAPSASAVEWVLIFVFLEHVILAVKMCLMWMVPNQPLWVRQALEKVSYQAKLALRNERGKKTRRHLSRRFRSVHGVPRSGSRSRGTTPVAQNGGLRHRSPPRDYRDY